VLCTGDLRVRKPCFQVRPPVLANLLNQGRRNFTLVNIGYTSNQELSSSFPQPALFHQQDAGPGGESCAAAATNSLRSPKAGGSGSV
jgi:hypothetical protein